jgi:acetylornithine deacetylase/succinyl-diaminopimelate desuccinylase-like protein
VSEPRIGAAEAARAHERLRRLVALPSVAADGRAIPETAEAVAELLAEDGFAPELHDTGGAPVVFAQRLVPGAPTLLLYNHYDVQPEDPLDAWTSPPFELTERDGAWYGRGAADDKGELVSRLAALRAFRARHGEPPFGVTLVIEGEEEIGSPHLADYVATHAERLRADGCLWEFGGVDAAGRPVTYCGMKGILTLELRLRTAGRDLHSSFGAVADGAAWRLAAAVASLRDADGTVRVDGFRDGVAPPSARDLALVDGLPDEEAELREVFGIGRWLGGVEGDAWKRALTFEPTINVNGFHAGYGGEGAKTVLPAEAACKLDVRLVPEQEPLAVLAAIERHLARHGFEDVEVVRLEHAERAARSDTSDPFVQEAIAALRETYGQAPVVYPNSAGSGPIHPFVVGLGVPVVGIGCGYPGSRIHGPDEHVRIADVEAGTAATVRLLERIADGGLAAP